MNIDSGRVTVEIGGNINELPDVFPSRFAQRMMDWDGVLDRTYTSPRPINRLITKSRLNGAYWPPAHLSALVDQAEKDNKHAVLFRHENRYATIAIWPDDARESTPPLGFVVFEIECGRSQKSNRYDHVCLELCFAWVHPDARGYGAVVARHLAAHFIEYLGRVDFLRHRVLSRKAALTYSADFESRGGELFSKIIEEAIGSMVDIGLWPFREFDIDVGY